MAVIRCPACGKPNPDFVEICQYCDARLKPLDVAPSPEAAGHTEQPGTLRCPACGKPNPNSLEVCQFCDARLIPMSAPLSPEAAASTEKPGTVRCPACGKPNPAFVEVCQFCDARLKPMTAGEPQAAEPADTLDRLRAVVPPSEPEPESFAPAPAQQEPDWLWTGTASEESEPAAPAAAEPDWMSSLRGASAAQPEPPEPAAGTGGTSEWMRALRGAAAEPEPEPEAVPAEEVPDWLKSMRGEAAAPEAAAPAEEVPDWMKSFDAAEPAPPEPTAAPAEEVPDWLRSMRGAEPAPPTPVVAPAEEVPDWMKSFGGAEAQAAQPEPTAAPAEDVPDWLGSMRGAEPALPTPFAFTPEPGEAEPTVAPAEETPDWLKSMPSAETGAPTASAQPATSAFTPEPGEAEPDWMKSFGAAAPVEAEPAVPADETPDWLRAMQSTDTGMPAAASPPAAFAPEPAAEEPDWLNSLRGMETTAPPAEAVPSALAPEPAGGEPDWLSSLRGTETTAPPAEAVPSAFAPNLAGGEPDWLSSLHSADTTAPPAGAAVSPFAAEAFVSPFTDQAPETPTTEAGVGPMPDWLSAMRPGDLGEALSEIPAQPASPLVGENIDGLSQTALPSWLEALRPVDVARPQSTLETDTYQETVGVLAGMRGVLRAEPAVALPRKNTVQLHELDVSDAQAAMAQMLTQLVSADGQAQPAAKARARIALPLERWLIFILLAAAILTPLALGPGLFPKPEAISLETKAAYDVIERLPANKPALVAFDYDPAQSGELNPAASVLVGHLMRRGVPVVGVSTRLAGAAVGDDLLQQLAADLKTAYGISYTYGVNYLNLGYLPGGPVGLLQFAAQPRSLFNVDFSGSTPVWNTSLMTQVQALGDFSLILLISATPDSARAWVEQTHNYAQSVPLLAAVSAGADPLVRPYYESNPPQISGLVSGLRGATQYEQQVGAPAAAGDRWDMLGSGLLGAAGLILAGSLINGVAGLLRRRKR